MRFEWDPGKSRANRRKHGVAFEIAQEVFSDEHARLLDDADHCDQEDRFLLLGISFKLRVLLVCHCYGRSDQVIRIISARKASRKERGQYEEVLP